MNNPSTPAAPLSADLARRMLSAVTTRDADELELAALPPAETELNRSEHAQALERLRAEHSQAIAQLTRDVQQEREALTAESERSSQELAQGLSDRLAEMQAELGRQLAVIDTKLHDQLWLSTSITDADGEHGPRMQCDRLRAQIQQSSDQITRLAEESSLDYQRLQATIERRRGLLEELPTPGRIPTTREELAAAAQGQFELFRQSSAEVERLILPRALVGWNPLWISLVLWLGSASVTWGIIEPQWFMSPLPDQQTWLLICVGIGLAFTLLSWFALYISAGQVTAGPLETAQQALADGRAAFSRWQRISNVELQQAETEAARELQVLQERQARHNARLQGDYAASSHALQQSFHQQTQSLRAQVAKTHERATRDFQQSIRELESRFSKQQARLDSELQLQSNRLTHQSRAEQAARQRARDMVEERTNSRWRAAMDEIISLISKLERRSAQLSPTWSEVQTAGWQPPAEPTEGEFRIGRFRPLPPRSHSETAPLIDTILMAAESVSQASLATALSVPPEWEWPAEWSYPHRSTLLLRGAGPGLNAAIALLQTAILRWLTQLPAGTVRLTICDPLGLGENFAAFMNLADFDELLITHRIWTEPQQIEEQLSKLTAHMETIFQKYLRNEFDSIVEYNRQAGEVAEPYRLLVIAGFPSSFTEDSLQRLRSIVAKGGRCGVATLLACDTALPCQIGFPLDEIEQQSLVLTYRDGRFVHTPTHSSGETLELELLPELPPTPPKLVSLVRRLGSWAKDLRRVEVSFHRVAPAVDQLWREDSSKGLSVPLGRAGATRIQTLQLGRGTSQHVLVAGKTGSGKSTLLHVVVTNLALRYSPDQIQFYLVDFKKGVEFKTYATHRLPHARTIAIESDREFGVSVLERLDAVLRERGDLFRSVGAQDLAGCRAALPQHQLPRVMLVVDEFQEFFVEDDRQSQQAALLLDRLVRQGRAFGIHVLLGSQSLGGAYTLPRTTLGQMAIRIALQCSEADAHLILSETNSAARLLTRPGEAIYNDANGMPDGNSPFQIAWLNDDERDHQLSVIEQLAVRSGRTYPEPVVFEGNKPSDPRTNPDLIELLQKAGARGSHSRVEAARNPDQDAGDTAGLAQETRTRSSQVAGSTMALTFWMGESIALAGSTAITLERRSGANLLLVGPSPAPARGVLANLALACLAIPGARVSVLSNDPSVATGGEIAPRTRSPLVSWRDLASRFTRQLKLSSPAQTIDLLGRLHAELQQRSATTEQIGPAWVIIVEDLAQFRDLRKGEDDYGFGGDRASELSPARQFAALLKDGPALGLHLAVWCDTPGNLERWVGRSLLREFESRVLFAISAGDSSNLCDSPAAARLGPNRALFYSDLRGSLDKFRPYAPPDEDWLAWATALLNPAPDLLAQPIERPSSSHPPEGLSGRRLHQAVTRPPQLPVLLGEPETRHTATVNGLNPLDTALTVMKPAEPTATTDLDQPTKVESGDDETLPDISEFRIS
jgi:S-DNA-T family DNA segregation ATPase FtsK/SpoIIIE